MGDRCRQPLSTSVALGLEVAEGRLHVVAGMYEALADEMDLGGRPFIEFQQTVLKLENPDAPRSYSDLVTSAQGKPKSGIVDTATAFFSDLAPADLLLGNKFTDPFSTRIRKTLADTKTAEQRGAWNKTIAPLATKTKEDIVYASMTLKPAEYTKYLDSRYGLKPNKVNAALQWLEFLEGGAHLSYESPKGGVKKLVTDGVSNLSAANARFNPRYIAGNVMDMVRIGSSLITEKDGLANIGKALVQTFKDGAWSLNETLAKTEISTSTERDHKETKFDPFGATVNLQRNFAYNLDKANGGDGRGLMSSHVFETEPWTTPQMYRETSLFGRQAFGLARFSVAETMYNYRVMGNMLGLNGKEKMAAGATEFLVYNGSKALALGAKAVLPETLLTVAKTLLGEKEVDDFLEQINSLPVINMAGKTVQAGLDAVTGKGTLTEDAGNFFTPKESPIPALGLMQKKWNDVTDFSTVADKIGKSDNAPQAVVRTLAAASTLLNLFPVNNLLNNTTTTGMINAWADSLGDDIGNKEIMHKYAKVILGSQNVKKGAK